MIRVIFAIAMVVASAFGASAESLKDAPAPRNWTGCHISAQVGYGIAQHDSTLDVVGAPASLNINSLSATGTEIGGGVGCDVQMGRLVFGLFGDYMAADIEHSTTAALGIANLDLSTTIERQWSIGGRVGVLLSETTLAYALGAYSRAESSDLKLSAGPLGNLSWDVPELTGLTIGLGIEHQFTSALALRAEIRHTEFDTVSVGLVPNLLNLGLETATDEFRVGLVWRP